MGKQQVRPVESQPDSLVMKEMYVDAYQSFIQSSFRQAQALEPSRTQYSRESMGSHFTPCRSMATLHPLSDAEQETCEAKRIFVSMPPYQLWCTFIDQ